MATNRETTLEKQIEKTKKALVALGDTRVTACTLALSPYFVTRFTRRLQPFRYLHSCSGYFRLEHFCRAGLAPTGKSAAFARRTPFGDILL